MTQPLINVGQLDIPLLNNDVSHSYVLSGQTTDSGTFHEIFVDGITNNRIVLPDQCVAMISIFMVARRTDVDSEVFGVIPRAVFYRNTGAASIARVGAVDTDMSRESMAGAPDMDLTADTTNGSIKIEVKGGSGSPTVEWRGIALVQQYAE